MKELLAKTAVRRLFITICVVAVIELMTGPPGSNNAPTSGFRESFGEASSFFGLFRTQRWIVFLGASLIAWGVASFWIAQGPRVRTRVHDALAVPRRASQKGTVRWGALGVLLFVAIILPHVETAPFWQQAMVEQISVYVLLAIGLNVVVGFAGLLDLGYVAFYAIGAYTTAWVTGALPTPALFHHPLNPFFAIPIAIFIVMAAGVLLGAPTLRLRGDYLAIVTLGFGEIITIFANNLYGITGGSLGTKAIPHPSIDIGPVKYHWGITPVPYYYLTLGFVVLFLIVFSLLERSRVGRSWTAIREDEVAAESVGINPLKYKVMAFAIGAASAGFAGVITASQLFYIFPSSFTLQFSINILVLVILGGMGSIAGVVLGAVLIQTASSYLLHSPPAGYQSQDLYMYLGALLITMMIFRPAGLIPSRRRKREIALSEVDYEGHLDEVLGGDDL
ncbi:MAG TPA: branched-chain amino acid ABC transporter permease [Acidimicrobiales bacterium]|nr:branched-chain amino acid ABC transporter permease [Acidimicrobiales bacterium]